jgi:outer membrane receptor protein involved in Fe transport
VTARRSRVAAASAAALLSTLSGVARADGPSDLEAALAEPVVTTASQTAEDQSTAPATSTTITADDLRRYGIKTLAEAINFLSLGMFTQNNLDDVEIGSRGVLLTGDYGDHVLLLVNGHAVNEQWSGTAYFGRGAGIPFELIDHIEVILGPGSVLYGSQAMLGVINIVTKRAKDFEGFHFVGEGELFTSGRGAVGFGREFTFLGQRGELTYELEYYAQSGPAFTLGPETYNTKACFNPSCTNPGIWGGTPANQSYWTKLPTGYLRLLWGDFELDLRAESYQRSDPATSYVGYNVPNEFEVDKWLSADLRHRWAISSTAQLKSRLYGDAYSYSEQLPGFAAFDCYGPPQVNGVGCMYQGTGYSRWVGLEEQLALDWLHDQSLTTLVGFDGRAIRVGEANFAPTGVLLDVGGPPPFGVFEHAEYRVAAYGQQTWRPVAWLSLNAGARVDDDIRDDDTSFGRVSPRGVIAINPWKSGTLKVIYSEAFRAPTYFETSFTDHQTTIPNLSLQPETVRSGEVTFEQRFGTQRLFVGGFDTQYSDMVLSVLAPTPALVSAVNNGILPAPRNDTPKGIVAKYGPQVSQYQNLSSIEAIGLNAAYEGTAFAKDLRYGVNFTYSHARQTEPNPAPGGSSGPCPGSSGPPEANCTLPVAVAPQVFGNARISYDLPGELPVVGAIASLMGQTPINHAFDSGWTPPPYTPTQVDLRGTISGRVPWVPALSYRFIVDYAVSGVSPYLTGPVTQPTKVVSSPLLVPVDQFRTTLGLQYDLH